MVLLLTIHIHFRNTYTTLICSFAPFYKHTYTFWMTHFNIKVENIDTRRIRT